MKKNFTSRLLSLIVFCLCFQATVAMAQPYTVTGTLQTQNVNLNETADFNINEPLVGIEVKLFDAATELDSDITDVNGAYSLVHIVDNGSLTIVTTSTSALQSRTLTNIPGGEDVDAEEQPYYVGDVYTIGARNVLWVEGSVLYQGIRYRTVTIGDQVWMAENLRASNYRNGDPIPNVTVNAEWGALTTGAWAVHQQFGQTEEQTIAKEFNRGKLYNWFAVNDPRGICPQGWAVPSDDDIKTLEAELGMLPADLDHIGGNWRGAAQNVSNALRSTGGGGDFFWRADNTADPAATNSTGFSQRGTSLRYAGGGYGTGDGDFSGLGEIAMIWTATENNANTGIRRIIRSNQAGVRRNAVDKKSGLAVRCVKVDDDVSTSLQFNDTDGAGWRMMSVPFYGKTVADLAAQNEVSGVPGANAFYGVTNLEELASNLNFFDPATFNGASELPTGWIAPENFNTEFVPGQAFIWYFFNNDNSQSNPLDGFNFSLTGIAPSTDVTVPLTSGTWNLVGNPFASNIDANQLPSAGLFSAAAQIWDSATNSYVVVDFDAGNTIATWQGFFIESTAAENFTIPATAQTADGATFYNINPRAKIAFTLNGIDASTGNSTTDMAISLLLDEEASEGWDIRDVRKLTPLTHQYATLAFKGMRGDVEIEKAQESYPLSFDESVELAMVLNLSNISGSFILEWDGLETFSNDLSITLTDYETGAVVDLRNATSYEFEAFSDSDVNSERFSLTLSNVTSSNPNQTDLPQVLALAQNYPNPFNPATQISFEIPQESHVRLAVYDMLGRRVAVLLDESRNPGNYQVTWDATRVASGMYLYRLEAGGQAVTKRMTLVK